MPSRVEALVRNFLKTEGEALCLVLGERLYLKRGTAKTIVGREPLSHESFRAIADELAPGELVDSLVETGHQVPIQLDERSGTVIVEFGLTAGVPSMTVVRAASVAAALATAEPIPASLYAGGGVASGGPAPAGFASEEISAYSASGHGSGGAVPSAQTKAGSGSGSTIDRILIRMLGDEASDLHLSAGHVPCFRVHGEIVPQPDLQELSSDDVERLLEPVIPPKNRLEFEERNDCDFAYEIEGVSRFRVNVFRDRRGVGAVLRQIPIEIKTAAQLNLPRAVIQFGDLSKGLVLVTGPTGSGKSTTLAAIIDHINETRTDHIITIEDPIEFVHPNKKCLVNQREIGSHTRGFKDALRAALREDPDIVLVGEMRDLETIAIAIETAETGHLVFGTLHTMTAASTVDRIVDQFPEDRQAQIRVMLADSLRGVVSQTLLRKKGGGRVAAYEILLGNGAVANLIRDAKTFQLQSVMQTSKGQGMMLLNDALLDLVKRGVVEPKEAYQKSVDKLALLTAMKGANIPLGDLKLEGPAAPAAAPAASPTGAAR